MSDITDQLNARVAQLSSEYDRIVVVSQSYSTAAQVLEEQNVGIKTALAGIAALLTKISADFPPA